MNLVLKMKRNLLYSNKVSGRYKVKKHKWADKNKVRCSMWLEEIHIRVKSRSELGMAKAGKVGMGTVRVWTYFWWWEANKNLLEMKIIASDWHGMKVTCWYYWCWKTRLGHGSQRGKMKTTVTELKRKRVNLEIFLY